jgi:hypothetical protein
MEVDAIWDLERGVWTGPPAHAAALLDPACLMAFPPPTGLLAGAAAIAPTLAAAPRWDAVTMADRCLANPDPALVVLAYRAEAQRGEDPPWRAICTSTWRRGAAGWRLVQHQQTPA